MADLTGQHIPLYSRLIVVISAAQNNSTGEGVAIKKITNVFSKKILAKRALRELKLLQHFRGMHHGYPVH
jgi:hypothetical protein